MSIVDFKPPEHPYSPEMDPDVTPDSRLMVIRIKAFAMIPNPIKVRSFNSEKASSPELEQQKESIKIIFDMMLPYLEQASGKKDPLGRNRLVTWWEFVPKSTAAAKKPQFSEAEEYRLWICTTDVSPDTSPMTSLNKVIYQNRPEVLQSRMSKTVIETAKERGTKITPNTHMSVFSVDRVACPEELITVIQLAYSMQIKAEDLDPLKFLDPRLVLKRCEFGPPAMFDPASYIRSGSGMSCSYQIRCPYPQYCFKVNPMSLCPYNISGTLFPWKDFRDTNIRSHSIRYCRRRNINYETCPFHYLKEAATSIQDDTNCRFLRKIMCEFSSGMDSMKRTSIAREDSSRSGRGEVGTVSVYAKELEMSGVHSGPYVGEGGMAFAPEDELYAGDSITGLEGLRRDHPHRMAGTGDEMSTGRRRGNVVLDTIMSRISDAPLEGNSTDKAYVEKAVREVFNRGAIQFDVNMLFPSVSVGVSDDSATGAMGEVNPEDLFYQRSILNREDTARVSARWAAEETRALAECARLGPKSVRDFYRSFCSFMCMRRIEYMDQFMTLWHPGVRHVAPAQNKVIEYTHSMIAAHGSLCDLADESMMLNVTPCGEYLCCLYQIAEDRLLAVSAHPWLILTHLVTKCSHDPERRQQFHIVLYGPPEAGKSYIFMVSTTVLSDLAKEYSRKTTLADTAGENTDGYVEFQDEMQQSYVGVVAKPNGAPSSTDGASNGSTGATLAKLRYENGVILTAEPTILPEGRAMRHTVAWCGSQSIYNSNDDPALLPAAIASRMALWYVNQFPRKDRTVQDVMNKKLTDPVSSRAIDKLRRDVYASATANFLIKAGVIPAPTMLAMHIKFHQLQKGLKDRNMPTFPPRAFVRVLRLARQLTITKALHLIMRNPYYQRTGGRVHKLHKALHKKERGASTEGMSKHLEMTNREVLSMFLDAAPLMYCTEDIAITAFASLYEINEYVLNATLWRLFVSTSRRSYVSSTDMLDPKFVAICNSLAKRLDPKVGLFSSTPSFPAPRSRVSAAGSSSAVTVTATTATATTSAYAYASATRAQDAGERAAIRFPPSRGAPSRPVSGARPEVARADEEEAEEEGEEDSARFEDRMKGLGLVKQEDGVWVLPDGADDCFRYPKKGTHPYFHQRFEISKYRARDGSEGRITANPNYIIIPQFNEFNMGERVNRVRSSVEFMCKTPPPEGEDESYLRTDMEKWQMLEKLRSLLNGSHMISPRNTHPFMRAVQIMMDNPGIKLRVGENGACSGKGIPECWKIPDLELESRLRRMTRSHVGSGAGVGAAGSAPSKMQYYWWDMSDSPRFRRAHLTPAELQVFEGPFAMSSSTPYSAHGETGGDAHGADHQGSHSSSSLFGSAAADRLSSDLIKILHREPVHSIKIENGCLYISIPLLEEIAVDQRYGSLGKLFEVIRESCVRETPPVRVLVPRIDSRAKGMPQIAQSFLIGPRDSYAEYKSNSYNVGKSDLGSDEEDEEDGDGGASGGDGEDGESGAYGSGRGAAGSVPPRKKGGRKEQKGAHHKASPFAVEDLFSSDDEEGPGTGSSKTHRKSFINQLHAEEKNVVDMLADSTRVKVSNINKVSHDIHRMKLGIHSSVSEFDAYRDEVVRYRIAQRKKQLVESGRSRVDNHIFPYSLHTAAISRLDSDTVTSLDTSVRQFHSVHIQAGGDSTPADHRGIRKRNRGDASGASTRRSEAGSVPEDSDSGFVTAADAEYEAGDDESVSVAHAGSKTAASSPSPRLRFPLRNLISGLVCVSKDMGRGRLEELAEMSPPSISKIGFEELEKNTHDGECSVGRDDIIQMLRGAMEDHQEVPGGAEGATSSQRVGTPSAPPVPASSSATRTAGVPTVPARPEESAFGDFHVSDIPASEAVGAEDEDLGFGFD